MSANLFADLFRWARRQDENFVTQAFAFLVEHLCQNDWEATRGFLLRLCFGEGGQGLPPDPPSIVTQVREDEGQPDMRFIWPNALVFVEVKVGSGVRASQIRDYKKMLEQSPAAVKRLVLLTRRPFDARPDGERPHDHVYWFQIGNWLRGLTLRTEVSRFLRDQFVSFLEGKRMAVKQITKEYVSGVQMFLCLIAMLERAIRDANPPLPLYQDTPSGGTKYWRFYLGAKKPYWVGIYFNNLEVIRFRFEKPFAADLAPESGWKMVRRRPALDYHLGEEFFSADAEKQKRLLTEFVSRAYREATQLRPK